PGSEAILFAQDCVALLGPAERLAAPYIENPDILNAEAPVLHGLICERDEGVANSRDFVGQVGNKALHTAILEHHRFFRVEERDIGTVRIVAELESLLGLNFTQRHLFNKQRQSQKQVHSHFIVAAQISRYVYQFSVDEFPIVSERVGESLEILDRNAGCDRHVYILRAIFYARGWALS